MRRTRYPCRVGDDGLLSVLLLLTCCIFFLWRWKRDVFCLSMAGLNKSQFRHFKHVKSAPGVSQHIYNCRMGHLESREYDYNTEDIWLVVPASAAELRRAVFHSVLLIYGLGWLRKWCVAVKSNAPSPVRPE